MISINGVVFSGSNVIIVNGHVLSEGDFIKTQTFDERKSEDADPIKKITIDSTMADVNVSVSNSSTIEVHFHGQAAVDGDINFDVRAVDSELKITLKFIGNCYNGSLKLDITVPQKTFKVITAQSLSADITLGEGVSADLFKIKTYSE